MGRYERSIYFNRLLELRASYRALDAADTTSVLPINEAAGFAERVFATVAASPDNEDLPVSSDADATA